MAMAKGTCGAEKLRSSEEMIFFALINRLILFFLN